jgi:ATP-dependent exoDNAse (exonuclease V) beta subunit
VVQGPPGTGKTHTIANVICHYLAQGKRVLVTSKGEAALSVLQQQIPEQIRQLTVSLLANEQQGKEQLERAANNINSKLTALRPSDLKAEISALDEMIEGLHQKIASIDSELRSWAKQNTEKSPEYLGGLSPEALAREVCALEQVHGWFPDLLDDRSDHEFKITDEGMKTLAAARMALRDKLEFVNVDLPSLADLPSSATMATVHQNLSEQGELADFIDRSELPRLPSHDENTLSAASQLHSEVKDHLRLIAACEEGWLSDLRVKLRERLQNGDEAILESLAVLKSEALRLNENLEPYFATAIELPDSLSGDEGLRTAIVKAAEGKRPFQLLQFGRKLTKQAFEQIKINGGKPHRAEEWKAISGYCSTLDGSVLSFIDGISWP